ncbi:MAG: hypothetical protein WD627_08195 [Actinomycetota bacterium]
MDTNGTFSPLQHQAKTETSASVRARLAHTAGNLDLLTFRVNDGVIPASHIKFLETRAY